MQSPIADHRMQRETYVSGPEVLMHTVGKTNPSYVCLLPLVSCDGDAICPGTCLRVSVNDQIPSRRPVIYGVCTTRPSLVIQNKTKLAKFNSGTDSKGNKQFTIKQQRNGSQAN